MNKKILSSGLFILIGILLGILISAIVAYSLITNKVQLVHDDYADEVHALSSVSEEAIPAIAQKDYVLAGLTLSSDFQELLEHGVQYGWWTEEYLTQVLIDDVIPVYIDQYAGTLNIIKGTEEYENLEKTVSGIIKKVKQLPKEEIRDIVHRLLMIDVVGIKNKVSSTASALGKIPGVVASMKFKLNDITDIVNMLQNSNLDVVINSIIDVLNQVMEIDIEQIKNNILNSDMVVDITNTIDKIENMLENTDSDYLFVEGENNILTISFTLTKSQATLLNAIDITIVEDTYNNNGTSINISDDTLVIGQIYLKFESSSKPGLDIVLGNITLNGKDAFLIHSNLGLINNAI